MKQDLKAKRLNFEKHLIKGIYFKKKELFDEALLYAMHAFKLKPNNYDVRILLAEIFFDSGQYSEAEYWYKKTAKLKPTSCINLMIIYSQYLAGNNSKAITKINEHIQTYRPFYFSFYLKGLLCKELGNLKEALESFKMALILEPEDDESLDEIINIVNS